MKKYTKKELFEMDVVDVYKLVLSGSIKKFPNGFWSQPNGLQNAIACTKFLLEDMLNFSDEDIKNNIHLEFFTEYKLGGMILRCFNDSPYQLLNAVYPDKFHPWELNVISKKFWSDKNNQIRAIHWLFKEKLQFSDEQIKEHASKDLFHDNGLGGLLGHCFKGSVYDLLNTAFPGKFHPWELKHVPINYWNDVNNGIKATHWLLKEKLQLSDEQIKKQLSVNLFRMHQLESMLAICFNHSPYEAVSATFPGVFHPWELNVTPCGIWNDVNNGIKATHWLLKEKLQLSDDEIKNQLSQKLFIENGLGGMLAICFNYSPYKAVSATFPGKFKPSDFKNKYSKNSW